MLMLDHAHGFCLSMVSAVLLLHANMKVKLACNRAQSSLVDSGPLVAVCSLADCSLFDWKLPIGQMLCYRPFINSQFSSVCVSSLVIFQRVPLLLVKMVKLSLIVGGE
jgi:hypothetical protein